MLIVSVPILIVLGSSFWGILKETITQARIKTTANQMIDFISVFIIMPIFY
jgi:hypothetical protein